MERKMKTVLSAETEFDLLFVHRDADAAGHEDRMREVVEASVNAELNVSPVPIIPVRTT